MCQYACVCVSVCGVAAAAAAAAAVCVIVHARELRAGNLFLNTNCISVCEVARYRVFISPQTNDVFERRFRVNVDLPSTLGHLPVVLHTRFPGRLFVH